MPDIALVVSGVYLNGPASNSIAASRLGPDICRHVLKRVRMPLSGKW